MLKVRIGKFKTKAKGKKGWTVAVVLKTKTYTIISYQGRYKSKLKAKSKKNAIEKELKQMLLSGKRSTRGA